MQAQPTAEVLFEALCKNAGAKFVATLGKIKGACDAIVAANGAITYSQVGKVAQELYGGPKTQSILNNAKHKSYIDTRRQDLSPTLRPTRQSAATGKPDQPLYPTEGLDFRTRRYIDDLRQRNSLLESAMRELKQHVLQASERVPLDLSAMLATPSQDGSAQIVSKQNGLPAEAREAVRVIVEKLPKLVPEVENYQGKALRLRSGDWLLPPSQYAALQALLGDFPPDAS
jgi:hypothetical protein